MQPKDVKIVQNQTHFSTSPYKEHVTPLPDALRLAGFPDWTAHMNLEGFLCGVLLYICAIRFDVVVSVSLLPSFVYGLLCRLLGKPKALHVCKEFYLEAGTNNKSLMKKFRLALLRFSLKNVDSIILNATAESSYYSQILGLPEDRFRFVAWPSNITDPEVVTQNSGYFLAVGKSLRDWQTFFKAVENAPGKYIVIAGTEDVKAFPSLNNVMIKANVNRQEYLSTLREAKGVILPLKPTIRSTGQASFLEAMAYGKPVIASDVVGVRDYLKHEENALLCRPEDDIALRECIIRINEDELLCNRIGLSGFQSIKDKFNKKRYAEDLLDAINGMLEKCLVPENDRGNLGHL